MPESECVKVIVRCRPMNTKEKTLNCGKIVEVNGPLLQIGLRKADAKGESNDAETKRFTFDGVYDDDSRQDDVYQDTAYDLVQSVFQGYNGTIFAYGQTGCGKTFTMEGVRGGPPELQGIIPKTFAQVFALIANDDADSKKQYLVRASYIEIYNEEVRDLMSDNPKARLEIKEDPDKGIYIKGLMQTEVATQEALMDVMTGGNKNRSVGATLMNADSSRSHSLFCVTIETAEMMTIPATGKEEQKIKQGKLNLVDLAGSERQSKTQAAGQRLKEATKINLSLSALGNVIEALVKVAGGDKSRHVPYRDSKLTRLLQDSLGGNTKTIMIAAVSPADYNYEETLSTLRYANRAKNIKNVARINEDPKDAMLREYQDEIKRLKAMLEGQMAAGGGALLSPNGTSFSNAGTSQQQGQIAGFSLNAGGNGAAQPNKSSGGQSNDSNSIAEDPVLGVVMSQHEKDELAQERAERAAEVAQLAAEREQHLAMTQMLEQQMAHEKSERAKLADEAASLAKRIAEEQETQAARLSTQTSELSSQLQAERERVESEQRQHEQLRLAMETQLAAQKAHADALQTQLAEKAADERRELEAQMSSTLNEAADKAGRQQEALRRKLERLQEKLLSSSDAVASVEADAEQRIHEARVEQKRLAAQQALLLAQKQKSDDKALFLEENYASTKDELADKTRKLKTMLKKYKQLESDAREQASEADSEKEALLQQLRDANKDAQLYRQIVAAFLLPADAEKIIVNSKWIESDERWRLPKIDMPIVFPTVRGMNGKELSSNSLASPGFTQSRSDSRAGGNAAAASATMRSASRSAQGTSQGARNYSLDTSSVPPMSEDPNAADASWKRSVRSGLSEADLAPTTRGKSTSVSSSASSSSRVAAAQNVDVQSITNDIKRRESFQPAARPSLAAGGNSSNNLASQHDMAAIHEEAPLPQRDVDEVLGSSASLPRRAAFAPAASTLVARPTTGSSAAAGQSASPRDSNDMEAKMNSIDSQVKRRAAFQPAAASSLLQSPDAKTGGMVPRPPSGLSTRGATSPKGDAMEQLLNKTPARASFAPAQL